MNSTYNQSLGANEITPYSGPAMMMRTLSRSTAERFCVLTGVKYESLT